MTDTTPLEDEVLRRMLRTPPKPHEPLPESSDGKKRRGRPRKPTS